MLGQRLEIAQNRTLLYDFTAVRHRRSGVNNESHSQMAELADTAAGSLGFQISCEIFSI